MSTGEELAYKGLVRPVLVHGSSVWEPPSITGNYIYETGGMTGIQEQLKWESLKKRRRESRLIMLYEGLKGAASIPCPSPTPTPPIRHVRKHHYLAFQIHFANIDIYKSIFFPQTIRDWSSLTDALLSAAECAEIETLLLNSLLL